MFDRVKADVDASFLKTSLAVTKVIIPEPFEALVPKALRCRFQRRLYSGAVRQRSDYQIPYSLSV